MKELLALIKQNPRLTNKQIASALGRKESDVAAEIAELERSGIICGYRTMIDWTKTGDDHKVTALIELKVTPRRDTGFDAIAEEILSLKEVESLHLMSGGYDFAVYVTGKTLQDVAQFVARQLSTIDSVVSTATTFILKRYKESGVVMDDIKTTDERRNTLL